MRDLSLSVTNLKTPFFTDPVTPMTVGSMEFFAKCDPIGFNIYQSCSFDFSRGTFSEQPLLAVPRAALNAELGRIIGHIQSYISRLYLGHDFLDLLLGQLLVTNRMLQNPNLQIDDELLVNKSQNLFLRFFLRSL